MLPVYLFENDVFCITGSLKSLELEAMYIVWLFFSAIVEH